MAKRFTDNEKWKDAWFMDLPSKYKLFWLYILDDCDHSGVWKINFKVAQFMVGEHLEMSEVKRYLKDRIIEVDNEYWFVIKFLKFQYPHGLKSNVKAQKSVINLLSKYKLIETVNKQLGNSYITVQDKDKDIDKDIDKNNDEYKVKSALEFLKENHPSTYQSLLMQNKSQIKDWDHFVKRFNAKVDTEGLKYDEYILRGRFISFADTWIINQEKNKHQHQEADSIIYSPSLQRIN